MEILVAPLDETKLLTTLQEQAIEIKYLRNIVMVLAACAPPEVRAHAKTFVSERELDEPRIVKTPVQKEYARSYSSRVASDWVMALVKGDERKRPSPDDADQ
ncbi:hypothetical protein [Gluconobacter kondonii]|uniref:hypothetical protein n=1 Tax=Gluconobacter kondonii TaxID=941463 RepID=UPI00197EA8F7|nr:hypothetical protein [Gluconobacter kondonii]MBN3866430.1 hypothetical protein [Gluconobacter kondonii]